jgi:hypothetical protein
MAKSKRERELFDLLRARGLRKRVARTVASGADKADGRIPKQVRSALDDLQDVVTEVEGRVTGKGGKRSQAAQKAARTRKRKAQQRSAAAKKAARSRASARS